MGATGSKALSSNISDIYQNTDVSVQETCNNSQIVTLGPESFNFSGDPAFRCTGTVQIGDDSVSTVQNCNQQTQLSVLSKTVADQIATSKSTSTGIGLAYAEAGANNFVEVTNKISAIFASNCSNSQVISREARTYNISGTVEGKDCIFGSSTFTQEATCAQSIIGDITNDATTQQSATATATAGIDLGQVILILLLIFGGGFLISIFSVIFKIIMRGSKKPTMQDASLSTLSHKLSELKTMVKARTSALKKSS